MPLDRVHDASAQFQGRCGAIHDGALASNAGGAVQMMKQQTHYGGGGALVLPGCSCRGIVGPRGLRFPANEAARNAQGVTDLSICIILMDYSFRVELSVRAAPTGISAG